MGSKLTPESQAAVRARIGYYRDLGVFDFYRRAAAGPGIAIETVTDPGGSLEDVTGTVTNADPVPVSGAIFDPETSSAMPSMRAAPPVAQPGKAVPGKDRAGALQAIRDDIGDCRRCALCRGRHTVVFGDGDPNARLLFVGEGPGADEDAQGLPFVGRAGQLLNNMIAAMGLRREQVYIANIVKCRPPQNRVPEPEEANTCLPFLLRQIDVIRPEVIVALGSTAATYLLGAKSPLGALRGRIHHARGVKLIVTYHPAYLLRDPRQKKEAWADLQLAMRELGLKAGAQPA